jgi:DNA-binding NarL/FixJ family response regulator
LTLKIKVQAASAYRLSAWAGRGRLKEEMRILKKLMPAVPVIIYSVHTGPTVLKEALEAGASALVSKSEPVAVLVGKARELLDAIAA